MKSFNGHEANHFSVQEAAAFIGISAHTLRYYERAGLIESVARNAAGHRRYAKIDLERLQFLLCLRAAGMPIRGLREFADLTRQGKSSVDARWRLLEMHKHEVQTRIQELQHSLEVIEGKQQRYREGLTDKRE